MEENNEIERVNNLSEQEYETELLTTTFEKTLKIRSVKHEDSDNFYDETTGWCYLGKIEWSNENYALNRDCSKWGSADYLWTKVSPSPFKNNEKYFSVGHPFFGELYSVPFDFSIIQFLRELISYERWFSMRGPVQNLVHNKVKIRLRGMAEWLEPDLEWYEGGAGGIKEVITKTKSNDNKTL